MSENQLRALAQMTLGYLLLTGQHAHSGESVEGKAFLECRKAFVEILKEPTASDASLRWASNLKTLALSKASNADLYLVRLGLFKLDGEAGSEYSCAASKRDRSFSVLLGRQLESFRKANSCWQYAALAKLDAARTCASQREFSLLVRQFRQVPLPDREGACSY